MKCVHSPDSSADAGCSIDVVWPPACRTAIHSTPRPRQPTSRMDYRSHCSWPLRELVLVYPPTTWYGGTSISLEVRLHSPGASTPRAAVIRAVAKAEVGSVSFGRTTLSGVSVSLSSCAHDSLVSGPYYARLVTRQRSQFIVGIYVTGALLRRSTVCVLLLSSRLGA